MINLIIDADATPTMKEIDELAQKYQVPITYIYDTAHHFNISYGQSIIVDKGSDSADYKILELANSDSIIITQDYALASLCLSKGAQVLHPNAFIIDNNNIDSLLNSRFLHQKARQAKIKTSNPKKRKQETNLKFKQILENMIKDN